MIGNRVKRDNAISNFLSLFNLFFCMFSVILVICSVFTVFLLFHFLSFSSLVVSIFSQYFYGFSLSLTLPFPIQSKVTDTLLYFFTLYERKGFVFSCFYFPLLLEKKTFLGKLCFRIAAVIDDIIYWKKKQKCNSGTMHSGCLYSYNKYCHTT